MQVKLHLVKGNPQGKMLDVPEGVLTIGRAEDSNLIIASTRISRHHCEIVHEANRLVIRDKGSGNGTFVNGVKIEEQQLAAGDEVQVGPLTFAVEIDGVREPTAAAPVAKPVARPAAPIAKAVARPAAPVAKTVAKPVAPVAQVAKPVARPGAPVAKPVAKPGAPVARPAASGGPQDILSSLEKLAGRKPGGGPAKPPAAPKDDNVLEISDDDLLDPDAK